MGRAAVRAAIVARLEAGIGTIPSLSKVFAHPPKFTPEGDFYAGEAPGVASGAVIYVHLLPHNERQLTIGAPPIGKKMRQYQIGLICYLRWKGKQAQTAGVKNDEFLDGLTEWIQATQTAGTTGAVFQWGEGNENEAGSLDIVVKAGMPKPLRQEATQVFTTVEVMALEILQPSTHP